MSKPRFATVLIALPMLVAGGAVTQTMPVAGQTMPSTRPTTAPAAAVATGTVTGISGDFGNLYTSIKADRYQELGLVVDRKLRLVSGETSVKLTVGETYFSVPEGEPVAVLHDDGLTFAIRDGNFAETHDIAQGDDFELLAINE